MDETLLAAFGNDPDLRQACERALLLHHRVRTGPLPYETVLALAVMLNLSMPADEAKKELPKKPNGKQELKEKSG